MSVDALDCRAMSSRFRTQTSGAAFVLAACVVVALSGSHALARGVTPYLPLNLDPEMQRAVERVLLLADQPIMARPIAAATVKDALPAACRLDRPLCERVAR